jgi:predicted secreted protein
MVQKIISFVFIYIMVFWVVIFCVLPIGIKREENPQPGNDTGAPSNPNLKKKFIYTALISLLLVSTYFYLKENGIIDMSELIGY